MFVDPDFATESTGAFGSFEEATRYLEQACAGMNISHLAYALIRSLGGAPDLLAWVATYDPAYMSYYMEHYTQFGDPAFETAFATNAVIDWAEMVAQDSVSQELEPVAARYGITKYGISIPLEDSDFGHVLFSVNVKSSDEEWPAVRDSLVERFRPLRTISMGASNLLSNCANWRKLISKLNAKNYEFSQSSSFSRLMG